MTSPVGHGELARSKLVRVLGADRGETLYTEILEAMRLDDLTSADALYDFAQRLQSRGGMEAAVGALLGVAAVARGAMGRGSPT